MKKKCILFMATNGVGLGHLTRLLAIARRVRDKDKEVECIFLVTSVATEIIRQEGFMYYYLPSKSLMPIQVSPMGWNKLLTTTLDMILPIYIPEMLVFDGSYPYTGLISNFSKYPKMDTVWIKREEYKEGKSDLSAQEAFFKEIIVPKEAGKVYPKEQNDSKKKYCSPIIFLKDEERIERVRLRKVWGVKPNQKVVYVQLGAGVIHDIQQEIKLILTTLLENKNWFVLLGESIISSNAHLLDGKECVYVVRDFPNAMYFSGCDFAISASGYNTFHELIYYQIPTLFIPNLYTEADNQLSRAQYAHKAGAGICITELSKKTLQQGMEYLQNNEQQCKEKCKKMMNKNGATDVAELLLKRLKK